MNIIKQRILEISSRLAILNSKLNLSSDSNLTTFRATLLDEIEHLEQELSDLKRIVSDEK